MRPITFPKTGPDEWTNHETGVRIVRQFPNGLAKYEVRRPVLNPAGWQHGSYRPTLDAARRVATVFAEDARSAAAAAYAEACREDAERMAKSEDDDLIHWRTSEVGALAACGVDVLHTPYTYGSSELPEVTCKACRLEA